MKGLMEILDGNLQEKMQCFSDLRKEVLQVSEKVSVLALLQRILLFS
jgi:hypothetical protein